MLKVLVLAVFEAFAPWYPLRPGQNAAVPAEHSVWRKMGVAVHSWETLLYECRGPSKGSAGPK